MFRLIASRASGLTLAGTLLLNNGSGEDVQNDDSFNIRSWWDTLKDKLKFSSPRGSSPSQMQTSGMYSETYLKMKKEIDENITPWDRVKLIFFTSGHQSSPELEFIKYGAETGLIVGFLYGGLREYSKMIYLFLYSNDANKYLNMNEAKAALNTAGLKAFFKGGFETSPKCGILSGIFVTVYSAVSAFRGKNGILEYAAAGAVTTAAMKFNLGIKGMISGCVTGGLTGLVLGSMLYTFSSVTNTNFFDARYYAYLKAKKEECILAGESRTEGLSPLQQYHFEKTKNLPIGFPD